MERLLGTLHNRPSSNLEITNMKICYFGTYRKNYSRNKTNVSGLQLNEVDVIECHAKKIELQLLSKFLTVMLFLIYPIELVFTNFFLFFFGIKKLYRKEIKIILVGFPGLLDLPIAFLLSKLTGSKLIFDMIISTYDTIVIDRKLLKKSSPLAKLLFSFEKLVIKLPDTILVDTIEDQKYFSKLFEIKESKFRVLLIGSDYNEYESEKTPDDGKFYVVYAGEYIPLHGIEHIIRCAKSCEDVKDVQFVLIGKGQLLKFAKDLADSYKLTNIKFTGWLSEKELANELHKASVILGIFQNNAKAFRVIPNKVVQGLALSKPVVTADTPAIRQLFTNRENILLCEAGSAESLKNSLLELKRDKNLRDSIAKNGHILFQEHLSPIKIGNSLKQICIETTG